MLSHFLKDRSGAFAPYFAIALLPLLGLMGASIDNARILKARQNLQSATDAAILAAASQASDSREFARIAQAWLDVNLDGLEADASVSVSGSDLVLTVTGTLDLPFLAAMGKPEASLKAEAGVPFEGLAFASTVKLREAIGNVRRQVYAEIGKRPYREQERLKRWADAQIEALEKDLLKPAPPSLSR